MRAELKPSIDLIYKGEIIALDNSSCVIFDPQKEETVEKIVSLNPDRLIILADQEIRFDFFVKDLPANASALIEFSEKPLTFYLNDLKNLAQSILDKKPGIQLIKDPVLFNLIGGCRRPLMLASGIETNNFPSLPLPVETDRILKAQRIQLGPGSLIRFLDK